MATRPKRTSSRRNRTRTKARLRLRVELLESRTVLSAMGPAAPGLIAGPPLADMLSRLSDAAPSATRNETLASLSQGEDAGRGNRLHMPPSNVPTRESRFGGANRLLCDARVEGGVVDLAIVSSVQNPWVPGDLSSAIATARAAAVSFDTLGSDVPAGVLLLRTGLFDGSGLAREQAGLGVLELDLAREPQQAGGLMEGGLVDLGVVSLARRRPADGPSLPTAQLPTALRTPASQAIVNVVSDLASRENSRSATAGVEAGVAAVSTVNPPDASKETAAANGGGQVVSPGGTSGLAAEWSVGSAGQAIASSTVAPEGGFIDIAPHASSLTKNSEAAPTEQSLRNFETQDGGEPSRDGSRWGGDSLEGTRVAEDGPAEASRGDVAVDLPEDAAQDPTRSSESAEGGMIVLAAAGSSSSTSTRDPRSSPPAADAGEIAGGKEVPTDHGVALFQAFELATSPAQQGDRSNSAWVETSQSGLPLEEVPSTGGHPPLSSDETLRPGDDPDGIGPQRAGILQAVAIASSLVAIDKARREAEDAERQRQGCQVDCPRSRGMDRV